MSCSLIEADHNLIIVIVEPCIEIPQKNGAQTILVVLVWNRLHTNKTIFLVEVAVEVALRLDDDLGLVQHELEVTVEVIQVFAFLTAHENGLLFHNLFVDGVVLLFDE